MYYRLKETVYNGLYNMYFVIPTWIVDKEMIDVQPSTDKMY